MNNCRVFQNWDCGDFHSLVDPVASQFAAAVKHFASPTGEQGVGIVGLMVWPEVASPQVQLTP